LYIAPLKENSEVNKICFPQGEEEWKKSERRLTPKYVGRRNKPFARLLKNWKQKRCNMESQKLLKRI
jgi:hypothetical protein